MEQAEEIKKQYGHAVQNEVDEKDVLTVRAFGDEAATQVSRRELAMIIEARMDEILDLVLQEIKRSGYDGLLPAGMILTGGSSLLPGTRSLASRVMNLPVRIARPENMVGLTDQLHSPAYSTSVGLLYWALMMSETAPGAANNHSRGSRRKGGRGGSTVAEGNWNNIFDALRTLFKRLLP
jgi:cell division protein FtsA